MTTKTLLTMYAGDCSVIRPVALPTLRRYAERHGFEVKIAEPVEALPAAWGKVAALRSALESSEFALWVDGDAILTPAADDLSSWLSANAFQCFSQDRRLPFALNSWLWGLRACDESRRFLEELATEGILVATQVGTAAVPAAPVGPPPSKKVFSIEFYKSAVATPEKLNAAFTFIVKPA
jgi:hypothetical protein